MSGAEALFGPVQHENRESEILDQSFSSDPEPVYENSGKAALLR